ncbi:protein containing AAA domain [Lentimicrobium saccharophilum]|uniref:Protein containing AAA domain n=2 Tax=Lentimicrobium saccharophilum TaxID=1678841 RepID=A0A0S7BVD6_9BACT|nr:protein containing AAA domain [Lentimicrobium saccharophilum]
MLNIILQMKEKFNEEEKGLDEDQISSDVEYYIANEREIQRRRKGIESQINIDIIIKRLNDWIQQQIIIGSSIGQINMNSIYLDLIYELLKAKKVKTQSIDKEPVLRSFDVIDEKIKEYSMFGLVNELDFSKIKAILSTTTEEQLFSAFPIIESFISTLNARLDALKKIHEIILSLINSVNTYFSNKRLSYNIKTGFIVKYITGEDINFNVLSSGEKQLLILLCNVIIASERATIFIIDEPELSLNIKWQRQLLQTLLTLNKEGHVQFLIATHSIELLTTFNNYTIKLESKR